MHMQEYLQHLIDVCSNYPITFSGDKPNYLNRWLIKGQLAAAYDEKSLSPHLDSEGRILLPEQQATLTSEEKESNWRYYTAAEIKTDYIDYSRNYPYTVFSDENDKYIYSLCCIYCDNEKDILFHVDTIAPIKIWINGKLVFKCSYKYHVKTHFFTMKLKNGNNTVLVEKPFFAEHRQLNIVSHFFTIYLKPCDLLNDQKNESFGTQAFLEGIRSSLSIIPSKAYTGNEEKLNFAVLPGYFTQESNRQAEIKVFGSNGKLMGECLAEMGSELSLDLEGCGVFRIEAVEYGNESCKDHIYVFKGDLEREKTALLEKAKNRNADLDILRSFEEALKICNPVTGCFSGYSELLNDTIHYIILREYFYFDKYVSALYSEKRADNAVESAQIRIAFKKSPIDDENLVYTVFLPKDYTGGNNYPLVLYLQYGYASSNYPIIPKFILKRQFENAIIVNVCGRGDLTRDYINEAAILELVEQICTEYNVNRSSIYLVGICTGSLRAYSLAIRKPDVFAGVAALIGTMWLNTIAPDYGYLQNLDNTPLLQLCNLDDICFNAAKVMNIANRIDGAKCWSFYNFGHIEFEEIFNNPGLIKKLTGLRKDRYPRRITHTVLDPIYNKAYWIKDIHMEDMNKKAVIEAHIKSDRELRIRSENSIGFSLLLSTHEMELESSIDIFLNEEKFSINIGEYSKITFKRINDTYNYEILNMDRTDFIKQYDSIGIAKEMLGIKQLYIDKCRIIKPLTLEKQRGILERKLFYMLANPLKERVRQYKYEILNESRVTGNDLCCSNFIYVADSRALSDRQKDFLAYAGAEAGTDFIHYNNEAFKGSFFAMIKFRNPCNKNMHGLMLVYNDDFLLNKLIQLINDFDINNIFYNDSFVYNQGVYHKFRGVRESFADKVKDLSII